MAAKFCRGSGYLAGFNSVIYSMACASQKSGSSILRNKGLYYHFFLSTLMNPEAGITCSFGFTFFISSSIRFTPRESLAM